jgi:hypothetical protein
MSTAVLELTAEQYHRDQIGDEPTFSSTLAHVLCTMSPAHAKARHPRLSPVTYAPESDAFDLGTVCHALLLGGLDAVQVLDFENYRTKAAQTARDEARATGLTPILSKHWLNAQMMIDRVREQLDHLGLNPPLFADGEAEVTLTWEMDGVPCRARLDWLRNDVAACDDMKTTTTLPDQWKRKRLYELGYDIRAAFYLRGIKAVTGETPTFRWLVAETEPPYAISVVTPGADVLALGNDKVDYALRRWRECMTSGHWPAYPPVAQVAELPAWEEARWLEKLAQETS